MQLRRLVSVLSLGHVITAFQTHADTHEICLSSPLLQHEVHVEQPICAAHTIQPAQNFIQVEPELWDENDERYIPAKDYKLSPPWKGPESCFTEFCIYSNKEIGGSGMVLITAARQAYLAAKFPVPAQSSIEPTAYYEKKIPGKGIGLVANRTIHKGEIIFRALPAMLIQATPHMDLDPEVREDLYRQAVDKLPESTREKFMKQMGDTIYAKMEKNAFRLYTDGDKAHSAHLASYPDVSRFNHDCRPNLHYRLRNLTHITVAVRDIPAGEELTISYIYGQEVKSERQSQLRAWGFECSCQQCTLSEADSAASDTRIRLIKELEEEIESKMASKDRGDAIRPEMGGKLVELYLTERLDTYLAPAFTRAALIYSMFGNEEKAREFATQAAEALVREYGPDARDYGSMKSLAEDPKGHWSWGIKVVSGEGGGEGRNRTKGKGK